MTANISDIGERGLIRKLRNMSPRLSFIGDDSAVLPEIHCPVVTTDSFFEGTHFHRWWAPPGILGRRLIEAALSDIAAMGAKAEWVFVALALDPEMRVDWIEDFYRGLTERDDITLAGGETVSGKLMGITITVIGEGKEPETLLRRSSLLPGDNLWISGHVGRALDAPLMLQEIGGFEGNDLSPRGGSISSAELEQLRAFLQPRAELELGRKLRESGVKCAIDISDGLISEAVHLSVESGVSVTLDIRDSLFYDSVKDRPLAASASGEDYILLFGASPGLDFSAEGCFLAGRAESGRSEVTVNINGETVNIEKTGYDHLEV